MPNCSSCSPSTPRSRSPTPVSTRRRNRTPAPRPQRPSGTGWRARCTTRSRRGSCRCCCSSGRRKEPSPTVCPTTRARRSTEARSAAEAVFEETRRSVLGLAPSPLEGRSLEEALELEIALGEPDGGNSTSGWSPPAAGSVPAPERRPHAVPDRPGGPDERDPTRPSHVGACRAWCTRRPDVTLLVQDDGAGFDQTQLDDEGEQHALGSAVWRERARLLGGALDLESIAGWGTRIRAWIPSESDVAETAGRDDRSRSGTRGRRPRRDPGRHRPSLLAAERVRGSSVVGEVDSGGPGHRWSGVPAAAPTSCSWTCRCSAATGSTPSLGSARKTPARASWRSRRSPATSWSRVPSGPARAATSARRHPGSSWSGPFAPPPAGRRSYRVPRPSGSIPSSTARAT